MSELGIALEGYLAKELHELVIAVTSNAAEYFIKLPTPYDIDFSTEEIAAKVAIASNVLQRTARFSAMAKAEQKLAKARFESKFKQASTGSNEAERKANAMSSATQEHEYLAEIEAVVELADGLETAARIASESARKILDKIQVIYIGSQRETAGTTRDADFRTY